MQPNTKEKIIETATQMFNEKGYQVVSMRNIADQMGISVGNLTYHFSHKQDLVFAVVQRQKQGWKKLPPARTLAGLQQVFLRVLGYLEDNRHSLSNDTQLETLSETAYSLQQEILRDLLKSLRSCIATLQLAGVIQPEEVPRQYDRLAHTLRLVMLYDQSSQRERLAQLWSLLVPVMTRKGKRLWLAELGNS